MPKPKSYPLKTFEKAVRILAIQKGFDKVEVENKPGSAVRFELYIKGEAVPTEMFVVHTSHDRKREVWSKDNYRKAARSLMMTFDEFMSVLEEIN